MVHILPITWTKAQFERGHESITSYTQKLIERNFPRGVEVNQDDAAHFWWLLINRLYPKGDEERDKWMSQIHSPNFHEYWTERDSQNGIHEQSDSEGFQRIKRPSTRADRQSHPGTVFLTKDSIETVIPAVGFFALKDVNYRNLVRNILEANPTRQIALPEMQLLWDAVVYTIFRFECSCAKEAKLNESTGAERFTQDEYSQLVLDVRTGVPPPKPRLLVRLPIPGHKRRREVSSSSESSGAESDVGAEENASPAFQAQARKRRSKRRHRSGPGSDFGVPGYPYVSPAHRSTSVAQGQLLSLPDTFAGPSTAPRSTSVTEVQWLDPRLVSGLALQENEEAEEDIGAWSL
ncbi:hypothetical protein BDR22DRAFT_909223 [Usnea florida]